MCDLSGIFVFNGVLSPLWSKFKEEIWDKGGGCGIAASLFCCSNIPIRKWLHAVFSHVTESTGLPSQVERDLIFHQRILRKSLKKSKLLIMSLECYLSQGYLSCNRNLLNTHTNFNQSN